MNKRMNDYFRTTCTIADLSSSWKDVQGIDLRMMLKKKEISNYYKLQKLEYIYPIQPLQAEFLQDLKL